jgi:uncharacterized protein YjcR
MDRLEDVILSTLAEIQENVPQKEETKPSVAKEKEKQDIQPKISDEKQIKTQTESKEYLPPQKEKKSILLNKENFYKDVTAKNAINNDSELLFLNSLRERMLVLFEGFQAPNNTALESKIDLTLNFLEYVLASIDDRIEKVKGK